MVHIYEGAKLVDRMDVEYSCFGDAMEQCIDLKKEEGRDNDRMMDIHTDYLEEMLMDESNDRLPNLNVRQDNRTYRPELVMRIDKPESPTVNFVYEYPKVYQYKGCSVGQLYYVLSEHKGQFKMFAVEKVDHVIKYLGKPEEMFYMEFELVSEMEEQCIDPYERVIAELK